MGASQSGQVADEDEEEGEEEEEEGDDDDGETEQRELVNPMMKKVLEQEPELLPYHASASPLSPQLSNFGTPRLGPQIKVWDPYNVLAPPPLPLPPPSPMAFAPSSSSLDVLEFDQFVTEVFLVNHGECSVDLSPDRVEMHKNIGEQRNSWNNLLLNSINGITLTATTLAGFASMGGIGDDLLALKLSSSLLFSSAAGMLLIMNKIQPSQLAEEQRNATRLFKQLHGEIKAMLAIGNYASSDINNAMDKVLALDKAFPLPLLGGVMIEKFPAVVEPSKWWPQGTQQRRERSSRNVGRNGWTERLEEEMKEIVKVLKTKDSEEYMRLAKLILQINKVLAISGPVLSGVAAVGSAFSGSDHGVAAIGVMAGALATIVNTMEHGGQVGMVFEMYRNCGSL